MMNAKVKISENYRVTVYENNTCEVMRVKYDGRLDLLKAVFLSKDKEEFTAFPHVKGSISLDDLEINIQEATPGLDPRTYCYGGVNITSPKHGAHTMVDILSEMGGVYEEKEQKEIKAA